MSPNRTIVVIPCYNEAGRLDLSSFSRFLSSHDEFEFRFVDDGSTDDTLNVLQQLQVRHPDRVSILSLSCNCGKAEAVRRGIQSALLNRPTAVAYWDADLATPLDEIPRFHETLHRQRNVDVVIGCRMRLAGHQIKRDALRRIAGKLFSTVASVVISIPIRDTQCGAKMFRVTPDLSRIFAETFSSRWIFDVELLARMKTGPGFGEATVFELPVTRWREVPGSRLTVLDCLQAAKDLFSIGWNLRATRKQPGNRSKPQFVAQPNDNRGSVESKKVPCLPEVSATRAPRRAA